MTKTALGFEDNTEGPNMKDLYPYVPELDEVEAQARQNRMRQIFAENKDVITERIAEALGESKPE